MNAFFIAAICLAMIIVTILLISSVIRYEVTYTQAARIRAAANPQSIITLLFYMQQPTSHSEITAFTPPEKSSQKFELIFVSTTPRTNSRAIATRLQRLRPDLTIKSFTSKRPLPDALVAAYQKHGRGKYVLALPVSSRLSVRSAQRAARELEHRPKLLAVHCNIVPALGPAVTTIAQSYTHLIGSLYKKMRPLRHIAFSQGAIKSGIMYRKSFFTPRSAARRASQHYQSSYLHSAVIVSRQSSSVADYLRTQYKQQESFFRTYPNITSPRPLALISAVALGTYLFGYGTYLAVAARQPIILIVTWGFLACLILFSLWTDAPSSLSRKATLTLLLPLLIPLSYAYLIVKILVSAAVLTSRTIRPA